MKQVTVVVLTVSSDLPPEASMPIKLDGWPNLADISAAVGKHIQVLQANVTDPAGNPKGIMLMTGVGSCTQHTGPVDVFTKEKTVATGFWANLTED